MGLYMSAVDTAIAREKNAARGGSSTQLHGQGLAPGLVPGPAFGQGQGLDAINSSGNPWYGLTHINTAAGGGVRPGAGGVVHPPSPGGMKKPRPFGGQGLGPNGGSVASPKVSKGEPKLT